MNWWWCSTSRPFRGLSRRGARSGIYAVRVNSDAAEYWGGGYAGMKDVATSGYRATALRIPVAFASHLLALVLELRS